MCLLLGQAQLPGPLPPSLVLEDSESQETRRDSLGEAALLAGFTERLAPASAHPFSLQEALPLL